MQIRFQNEVYDLELRGHRKLLHEDIERAFHDMDLDYGDYADDLDTMHALISAQDVAGLVDGLFIDGDIYFMAVNSDELLADALTHAGYQFQKSHISRSLYAINDNGEEVRISDHKRPAIVDANGVVIHEHEYKEIITDNNIIGGHQLQKNGFSRLTKSEYLLG